MNARATIAVWVPLALALLCEAAFAPPLRSHWSERVTECGLRFAAVAVSVGLVWGGVAALRKPNTPSTAQSAPAAPSLVRIFEKKLSPSQRLEALQAAMDPKTNFEEVDALHRTPLHLAVLSGDLPSVTWLRGKTRNGLSDVYGDTPLHSAAVQPLTADTLRIVRELLRSGDADLTAENLAGEIPFDLVLRQPAMTMEEDRVKSDLLRLLRVTESDRRGFVLGGRP